MPFVDVRDNRSSSKTALVRLNPGTRVDDQLVFQAGTDYTFTFNEPVSRITVNGVEIPDIDWSQTGTTITVDLGVVITTEIVIAEFYLFICSGPLVYLPEDPYTGGTEREWEPRITNAPSVSESIENLTEGILSISATTFTVINTDRRYNYLISTKTSFVDRVIKIWYKVDTEVVQVFEGLLSTPRIQGERLTFNIKSSLAALKAVALMGDLPEEAYAIEEGFPDVPDHNRKNRPIPMVFGRSSPVRAAKLTNPLFTTVDDKYYDPSYDEMLQLTCIEQIGTAFRRWAVCRLPPGVGLYATTVTVPSGDMSAAAGFLTISNFPASMLPLLRVGDELQRKDATVAWVSGSRLGHVQSISGTTVVINTNGTTASVFASNDLRLPAVQIQFADDPYDEAGSPPSPTSYKSHTSFPEFASASRRILIEQHATEGGGTLLIVEFVSGFEGDINFPPFTRFDVATDQRWKARVITDTDLNHSDAVEKMVAASGLPVLASSFTVAKATLTSDTGFLIPPADHKTIRPYYQYIQQITAPAFGYIRSEPDPADDDIFKIGYHLFPDTVPTPAVIITDDDILNSSLAIKYVQDEIITELRLTNKGFSDDTPSSGVLISDKSLKYLHNRESSVDTPSGLLDTQRAQRIFDFRSKPKRVYTFTTKTKHLDAKLGDTVKVENDNLPGGKTEVDLFIVGLKKSLQSVVVTAIELGD